MSTKTRDEPDFRNDRTAAHRAALEFIPENAGPRMATAKGGVVYSIRPPGSQKARPGSHLASVMLAPCRGIETSFGDERSPLFNAPTGMIVVNPAGWESAMSWRSRREEIVITIGKDSLLDIAQQVNAVSVELYPPDLGTTDPVALRIAQLIRIELQHETSADLYVDSLVTLFGIHLLRTCSSAGNIPFMVKGGLSAKNRKLVLDYMARNLSKKISVAELASLCHLSAGHFLHSFTRSLGQSPHKVLIDKRLDLATKLLREGENTLSEIAFQSGFASQSHLTSAMRRHRKMTPGHIRSRR